MHAAVRQLRRRLDDAPAGIRSAVNVYHDQVGQRTCQGRSQWPSGTTMPAGRQVPYTSDEQLFCGQQSCMLHRPPMGEEPARLSVLNKLRLALCWTLLIACMRGTQIVMDSTQTVWDTVSNKG